MKAVPTLFALGLMGLFLAAAADADTWTGAAEPNLGQTRSWGIGGNWLSGVVPPPGQVNSFGVLGDGTVTLDANQVARGLTFANFTTTRISWGIIPATLTLPDPGFGNGTLTAQEGMRDTYGHDYFTAGPRIDPDLVLIAPLTVTLGAGGGGAYNSAMMIAGRMLPSTNLNLTYNGNGRGNSLWVTALNNVGGATVTLNNVGGSQNGHILYLADAGRLDGATINLTNADTWLGLRDGGPPARCGVPPPPHPVYFNDVTMTDGSVIFADRSYQLNDLDSSINRTQVIDGMVTVNRRGGFGSDRAYGRMNNGYWLGMHRLKLVDDPAKGYTVVQVNHGFITQGRGGNRYVSGANQLQEPENVVTAWKLEDASGNLRLGDPWGPGVLWLHGDNSAWQGTKTVVAGVLRIGCDAYPCGTCGGCPAPGCGLAALGAVQVVTLATNSTAVGVGFDTAVDLSAALQVPFTVVPGGNQPGQSGAFDIDKELWRGGHTQPINTNIPATGAPGGWTYLRVGSSCGGDASFDPFPLAQPGKHAGTSGTITPYWGPVPTYFLGGGGGTLRIDSVLGDPEPGTALEMGTTGSRLLPGRIALNPMTEVNMYTGPTDVRAGTLQLLNWGAVWGTPQVSLSTYNARLTNGIYNQFRPNSYGWAWTGPGMLLINPDPTQGMNLSGYFVAQGTDTLASVGRLLHDGGIIGWTGNVTLDRLPGAWGLTLASNLRTGVDEQTNILGLGGEYTAGTMTQNANLWTIADGVYPTLLYKCGIYSTLDLATLAAPWGNFYTGGTVIAGGTVIVSNANQLNADEFGSGGPIVILNGGRLRVTDTTTFITKLMPITSGTPGAALYNGSMIEVDFGKTATFTGDIDTSPPDPLGTVVLAPQTPIEKLGTGTLELLRAGGAAYPATAANQWGLKLTEGVTVINQLPYRNDTPALNAYNGYLVFNGGDLQVRATPAGVPQAALNDPTYGFAALVSFAQTLSRVTVDDGGLLKINGASESQVMGRVEFRGVDQDADASNNVVHLSRAVAAGAAPGADSRGTGTLAFENVTVYTTPNPGNFRVLPLETAFTLEINDGAVFHHFQSHNGNLIFNAAGSGWVRINGATADSARALTDATWTIQGTGTTSWSGLVEKIATPIPGGRGTVTINRSAGAPVIVNPGAALYISGGTVNAGGTADPFTDTLNPLVHLNIANGANFNIKAGFKAVGWINPLGFWPPLSGSSSTSVFAGATLEADNLRQVSLSIGSGAQVRIRDNTPDFSEVNNLNVVPSGPPGTGTLYVGAGKNFFVNPGGLFFIGAGSTLVKSGGGALLINATGGGGTLAVNAGTLGGTGIINSAVTINSGGTLAPGQSVGTLTINNNLTFANGGNNWVAELLGAAADRVDVAGTLTLGDATALNFVFDPANPWVFEVGSTYTLASYGTLAGTFSSITNLGSLGAYSIGVVYGPATNGTINIQLVPDLLAGDATLDRNVDFLDYVRVATNYGVGSSWTQGDVTGDGAVDFLDYVRIATNYGAHTPEPATLALLGLGGLGVLLRRKRR